MTQSGRQRAWEKFCATSHPWGRPGARCIKFNEIKEGVGERDNLPLLEVWFRDSRGSNFVWVPKWAEVREVFLKAAQIEGQHKSGWDGKQMEAFRQAFHASPNSES